MPKPAAHLTHATLAGPFSWLPHLKKSMLGCCVHADHQMKGLSVTTAQEEQLEVYKRMGLNSQSKANIKKVHLCSLGDGGCTLIH